MNRQQKRSQGIKTKTPTYNLTKQQLEAMISKDRDKLTKDVIVAINNIYLLQLHDKFGFGEKRLTKLMGYVDYQIDCLLEGLVTLDDLKECIEKEIGIKVVKE